MPQSVQYGGFIAVSLIWQLDSIRVLPFPFVLIGKNLFQPVGLLLGDCLVHEGCYVPT
jgi:hypothetical protein